MADLGETRRRRRADLLGRALRRYQLGKPRLDVLQALQQRIVLGVGDDRRVFLVIQPVVLDDFRCQARVFARGVCGAELVRRR